MNGKSLILCIWNFLLSVESEDNSLILKTDSSLHFLWVLKYCSRVDMTHCISIITHLSSHTLHNHHIYFFEKHKIIRKIMRKKKKKAACLLRRFFKYISFSLHNLYHYSFVIWIINGYWFIENALWFIF